MTDIMLDAAYGKYSAHAHECPVCNLPTLMCEAGKTLHREWHVAAGAGADLIDGDASKPYTVAWKDTETGEWFSESFASELQAARCIGSAELYANLELLAYTSNIDRSRFRY